MAYFRAHWDGLGDHLKDFPREVIFNELMTVAKEFNDCFNGFATASEFCE